MFVARLGGVMSKNAGGMTVSGTDVALSWLFHSMLVRVSVQSGRCSNERETLCPV